MSSHSRRRRIRSAMRATLIVSFAASGGLLGSAAPARADAFQLTDIVTDDNPNLIALGFPKATTEDSNLVNPWGVSFILPSSPFWISDNGTGLTSLYHANGMQATPTSPVTIAPPNIPPPGFTASAPTGQVNNQTSGFVVTEGGKSGAAVFIFAAEDGTISGWNPNVDSKNSVLLKDNSGGGNGAVYKGLAIGPGPNGLLYAANFRASAGAGAVEVYNQNMNLVNTITDKTLPPGYAPFNVQVLNGKLYVSFALQDPSKNNHDDLAGAGHGFVDVFNLDGTGMKRLVSMGVLDSPWGLAIAPAGFGTLAGDLLVGNFGSDPAAPDVGSIHAFDPNNGMLLGTVDGTNGNPIQIPGLWDLTIGNHDTNVDPNAIYFTAGISTAGVPDSDETHGLFGDIAAAVPEPRSLALLVSGIAGFLWFRRRADRARSPAR